jgi:cell division protein FtsA
MCTILGLLAKGDMNCAGEEISNNLFGTEKPTTVTAEPPKEPRPLSEITGKGIVQTEAEKAADEEARRKKQIEDEARRKAEEAEEERRRLEKRQNSWLHKTINSLKNFGKKIVEDDE